MAGTSLLALLDDIASILDDVAAMSKVAARKTASVLSDDLALNAEQVSGVKADRELPVVWKVARGSLVNKAILVPLALAISAFIPWAIQPLLMLGGGYLCYEGVEKLIESWRRYKLKVGTRGLPLNNVAAKIEKPQPRNSVAEVPNDADVVALEDKKVKGAVRTDFILSAEIIVISLGIVAGTPLLTQVAVMVLIAVAMTVGVYGVVAAIVKLDDLGLYLSKLQGPGSAYGLLRALGRGVVNAAPVLMKALSAIGTIAMFLVGGGILAHGLPWVHGLIDRMGGNRPGIGGTLVNGGTDMVLGLVAGALVVVVVSVTMKAMGKAHS